jgi:hypothetical protein
MIDSLSTDELNDLQEQTGIIAGNLKYIEENMPGQYELEHDLSQTNTLVGNLQYIEGNMPGPIELDDLGRQVSQIAENLSQIANDETDFDALEAQLDRIIEKFGIIREHQTR